MQREQKQAINPARGSRCGAWGYSRTRLAAAAVTLNEVTAAAAQSTTMLNNLHVGAARACGRSRVRDMTTRAGAWPPSRRVVSRGSSRRTVCPPTTTASDRARQSNTRCRDRAELTHAACPADVAILPSSVIAYFSTPSGFPISARCSSACGAVAFACF